MIPQERKGPILMTGTGKILTCPMTGVLRGLSAKSGLVEPAICLPVSDGTGKVSGFLQAKMGGKYLYFSMVFIATARYG